MLHNMPQHLTILTTGSVFQRKLQVRLTDGQVQQFIGGELSLRLNK